MRYLFIRSTSGVSGAEIYTIRLIAGMNKSGEYSQLLTNYKNFIIKSQKYNIQSSYIFMPVPEIATKKNSMIVMVLLFYLISAYILRINQIEYKNKFDVIILESLTEKLFLSPYLRLFGYRIIWIEHGPVFKSNRFNLVKLLYKYKSKWADKIITVSKDTENDLINGGVLSTSISTVYIGTNLHKNIISKFRISKKQWLIGYIGSISMEKGIFKFVDIANKLINKKFPIKLIVLGDGPLLPEIKSYIIKLGLIRNYVFYGRVDNVWKIGKQLDILFSPTYQEGLSLAILESLTYGKIVVARDVGGNRELVIDKKTGFLFKTDEEGERILEGIVSGKISTKGIREAALEHVRKNFNITKQVPKFIKVFHG